MRVATVLTLIFSTSVAGACPNLSGVYDCSAAQDGSSPIEIKRSIASDVTTYTLLSGDVPQVYIADGNERESRELLDQTNPEVGEIIKKITTTCYGQMVKVRINSWVNSLHYDARSYIDLTVRLDERNNFVAKMQMVTVSGEQTREKTTEEVCKPLR